MVAVAHKSRVPGELGQSLRGPSPLWQCLAPFPSLPCPLGRLGHIPPTPGQGLGVDWGIRTLQELQQWGSPGGLWARERVEERA